jgi:hypothetical protein
VLAPDRQASPQLPTLLCSRCQGALEPDDLRCPVCGLTAPIARRESDPEASAATVVRCRVCNASVSYSAEAQAPRCAFCGSVMEIEVPDDPVEQAQAFLAFDVDPAGARKALQGFLSAKKWFRPSDLASGSTLDSLKPVWWPAWVFNAQARVSWTADSDAGAGRADWAPHAGQSSMVLRNVLVSASRGLTEEECSALAGHYDLNRAATAPRGPEGAQIERFDMPRSAARALIQRAVEKTACSAVSAGEIPGSRFRKVGVATLLTGLDTMRYALPAYVLAYRYRGRLFRAVVHGQGADCVIGDAPFSKAKIAAAILGGLLALGAIAGIVYLLVTGK